MFICKLDIVFSIRTIRWCVNITQELPNQRTLSNFKAKQRKEKKNKLKNGTIQR